MDQISVNTSTQTPVNSTNIETQVTSTNIETLVNSIDGNYRLINLFSPWKF